MYKIAIFASGSGTNAENLARYFNAGSRARVSLLISNRSKAGVLARMSALGVETAVVANGIWDSDPGEVVRILREHEIDLVLLAGFMHYVAPEIVAAYKGRILNIHPSLLPAYGGKGMYGHHVHEAVIAAGEKKSGVTVHYVTDEMDQGEILLSGEVDITPEDTPETLESKIHPVEYEIYPRAVELAIDRLDRLASHPVPPNPDQAWAKCLKIKYDPEKIRKTVPPTIPEPPAYSVAEEKSANPVVDDKSGSILHSDPMPPSYLILAVLSTVFCCLPLGIVAIIYSSKVNGLYYSGDIEGSRRASRRAQIWIIAAFSVGITLGIIFNILQFIMAV